MFLIQKIFKVSLLVVLMALAGCSSSEGVTYEPLQWLEYSNDEIGISFEYPDYYGEPNLIMSEGAEGKVFYLQFEVPYKNADPYLIYVTGVTSDYEIGNDLVRSTYKGGYAVTQFCDDDIDFLNFVDYKGDDCLLINDRGSLQNYAIVDAVGSSVEQIYLSNFATGDYSGLQVGFRVPFDYVEYGALTNSNVKGDNAVQNLVDRLDKEDVPKNLIDELGRFRVLLDSLEFI